MRTPAWARIATAAVTLTTTLALSAGPVHADCLVIADTTATSSEPQPTPAPVALWYRHFAGM